MWKSVKFHCNKGRAEFEDLLGSVREEVAYNDHGWQNTDSWNWKNRLVLCLLIQVESA